MKITKIILLVFGVGIIGATAAAYYFVTHTNPAKVLSLPLVQQQLEKRLGEGSRPIVSALPDFLGINEPRTYLLLFLNNTELRPGGGFIGSYAVVRFEGGHPQIIKVEGTETIDRLADTDKLPKPPAPLTEHLGVGHWYFRDSNWSPDFSVSARQSLDLYKKEDGTAADDIDAVIGVTTHVLEEMMRRSGPITVKGIEFTADNVIEKLEYEVEYGYRDRGVDFRERKQVLGELFHELVRRLGPDAFKHLHEYAALVEKLTAEKHIMAWSPQQDVQEKFSHYGWAGTFAPTTTDYLLWVDANLAALKTDHAMKRNLQYSIARDTSGQYIGTARMTYTNTGKFDWRTTRYRTYARVFVPSGAELVRVDGAMKWDRSIEPGVPTTGQDLNSTVFGAFISIEPGTTKTLTFVYTLSPQTAAAIQKGDYSLAIPKQLGATAHALTLTLDFGTNIKAAAPAEDPKNWGNTAYTLQTDLSLDRFFKVNL